ncbi:hypothetical protein [Pseudoalteromonas sp. GB43]
MTRLLLDLMSSIELVGSFWGYASVLTVCITAIILQKMEGAAKKE